MSGCSWGRTILDGTVTEIHGTHSFDGIYLEAMCGIGKGHPAMLKVSKQSTPTDRMIRNIPFTGVTDVDHVKDRHGNIVVIKVEDNNHFLFYAESAAATKKWFKCCGLLLSLPCHFIPAVPEENLVPQTFTNEFDGPNKFDAVCVWVVHILSEGIVMDNPTLAGLRIISIRSSDCTFNVHDYPCGDLLLSWGQAAIRRSGHTKSLVFLEASKQCRGGPGLLWMHHPLPRAKELRQCLHDFLHYGPEDLIKPRSSTQFSCDALTFTGYCKEYEALQGSDGSVQQTDDGLCRTIKQSSSFQALKDVHISGLSQGSTASSGYYSDIGLSDHPVEDAHSSTNNAGSPFKHRDEHAISSNNNRTALNSSKHPACFKGPLSSSQYENFEPLNVCHTPPVPPRSVNKVPLYENHLPLCNNKTKPKRSSDSSLAVSHRHKGTCEAETVKTERETRSLSGSSSPLMSLKHQQERKAFLKCTTKILENLSVKAIQPHLMEQELLTQQEIEIMMSESKTNYDKVMHLISELPRKGDGFFEKFILCLCKSKNGTGHDDIVKSLTVALGEVKKSHLEGESVKTTLKE